MHHHIRRSGSPRASWKAHSSVTLSLICANGGTSKWRISTAATGDGHNKASHSNSRIEKHVNRKVRVRNGASHLLHELEEEEEVRVGARVRVNGGEEAFERKGGLPEGGRGGGGCELIHGGHARKNGTTHALKPLE